MSVPICKCKVGYDMQKPKLAYVELCAFHRSAGELFEIVDALVSLREQVPAFRHTAKCRCLHCRSIRALAKARTMP